MAERTEAQRSVLQAALDEREPGRFATALGQRHAAPFIENAVTALASGPDPVDRVVGLVLAPHYSAFSIGHYATRLAEAAAAHGLAAATIEHWHLEPAYVSFLSAAVVDALASLDAVPGPTTTIKVVFTAHSLPERLLVDDPYPGQLRDSAAAVAERAGLTPWAGWAIGWQSAGATPEPWRGPDITQVIRDLAGTGRSEGVVVCPQGFVSDHLEVLYDLDIEARGVAEAAGLRFARTRVLNADPTVLGALADRVVALAGENA
jgi:ferrochelatase